LTKNNWASSKHSFTVQTRKHAATAQLESGLLREMKMFRIFASVFLGFALASAPVAAATNWNLTADYLPAANPNGAWTYGSISGSTFSALAWNAPTSSYGIGAVGETFIYQNNSGFSDYGIAPGKISLESDWGNAAVRWTAPSTGQYMFAIGVGGTTANGPGGFGNNFAQYAGVKINGVDVAPGSFFGNVKQWGFSVTLSANSTVDTFVLNPGFASGGNTQTEISVSAVPEPASALAFGLGLGALLIVRRQVGRQAAGDLSGACALPR
jgi:hypothetical protein